MDRRSVVVAIVPQEYFEGTLDSLFFDCYRRRRRCCCCINAWLSANFFPRISLHVSSTNPWLSTRLLIFIIRLEYKGNRVYRVLSDEKVIQRCKNYKTRYNVIIDRFLS